MINTLSPAWSIDIPATSRLSTRAALIELFDAMVAVRACLDLHEAHCPGAVEMLNLWAAARGIDVVRTETPGMVCGSFAKHVVRLDDMHMICVYQLEIPE